MEGLPLPCRIAGLLATAAVASILASCAVAPLNADPLSRAVSDLLEPLVSRREFSGAVALMRGDQLVYARGFGLAGHDPAVAFGPQTPSDGASLAKTFTAAGLWWLVHEGRLTMGSQVQDIVPEYPHSGVTVAHLIAHSNGLARDYEIFDRHFSPGQPRPTEALLRVAGQMTPAPAFEPGTRFEYTNLGYDAAGLIIERMSGQRYGDFVRDRFFRPHGLTDSFARPPHFADWPVPRTRGYRFRDGRWQDHDAYDDEAFFGASNLMFSAVDLARWGNAWAHARVLPVEAERLGRVAPRIGGQPSSIDGLSWYCAEGGRRCHYTGSLNGFHALVYWDRDRLETVAYVSNSSLGAWNLIPLQRALVDLLAGRPVSPMSPDTPALAQLPRADSQPLAGRYHAADLGIVQVNWNGQVLQLQVEGGLQLNAYRVSRSVLYVPGNDWFIAFSGDTAENPKPAHLHIRSMYLQAQASRLPD